MFGATGVTPIPVVLSFDLEPDGPGQSLAGKGTWHGVDETRGWVDGLRARIEASSGRPARVSWMVRCDPQVEAAFGSATDLFDRAPSLLADADDRGDATGLHIHAWRRTADGGWVDDFGDDGWLAECIDRSHAAFLQAVGRPCRLVSMGNRFLGPTAIARMLHHGTAIDMTGEAAAGPVADGGWPHVGGAIPDYRRMPRGPHLLAPGLIELPLSAGRKRLGPRPRAHLSRMRRHGLFQRLDQPVQLGGKDIPGVGFGELMADSLRRQKRPHLVFAARSDGLLDPVQRPRLLDHMEQLLALPDASRFWLATPAEAVEALGGP
jgi:hypothetical protein